MFLTELDPRAAVKGSRDPLGFQPVWTRFGRRVVGNLTTVTTSVRSFTVLLLGLYFAEQVIRSGKAHEEDRSALFIKFEQLAAYSRVARWKGKEPPSLLGIRRVQRRVQEHERLRISADRDAQILGDQKTYGVWGLYSVSGGESGYCEDQHLTPEAEDFVLAEYLPRLSKGAGKDGKAILRFLASGGVFDPGERDAPVAAALAGVLGDTLTGAERGFYGDTLVLRRRGGTDSTDGRQGRLWELLREIEADAPGADGLGRSRLVELGKRAVTRGYDELAQALARIGALEPVLAASRALFMFLLQRNGVSMEAIEKDARDAWGVGLQHLDPVAVGELEAEITAATDAASARRIIDLAEMLRDGDFAAATRTALEQNATVMATRGGNAWAAVEGADLAVRLRVPSPGLPEKKGLPDLWDNSYFVDSLSAIGSTVFTETA